MSPAHREKKDSLLLCFVYAMRVCCDRSSAAAAIEAILRPGQGTGCHDIRSLVDLYDSYTAGGCSHDFPARSDCAENPRRLVLDNLSHLLSVFSGDDFPAQ